MRYILLVLVAALVGGCSGSGDYKQRIASAADTIRLHGLMARSMCEGYETAWSEAIESGYKDFNKELASKYQDYESQGMFTRLDQGRSYVDSVLKLSAEPPDDMKETHRKVMDFYGNYVNLLQSARQPEGTLVTFRQKAAELGDDHIRMMNELRVMNIFTSDSIKAH